MSTFSSLSNALTEFTAIFIQYYIMVMIFYYICQLSIRSLHNFQAKMKKLQYSFSFHPKMKENWNKHRTLQIGS